MRRAVASLLFVLVLLVPCLARERRPPSPFPDKLVIARDTFFDFGPPFDYYELLLVSQKGSGSAIERVMLTPPGDVCFQPAKIEMSAAVANESVRELLGLKNPCDISQKDVRRELKRRKKGLVFSGVDVAIQVRCGSESRNIRADILDRDMFDPVPSTPVHTSWTMEFLARLDKQLGPGAMDKPVFPIEKPDPLAANQVDSPTLADLESGKYDELFVRALGVKDRPSDLYRASRVSIPVPLVKLSSVVPVKPLAASLPKYPPLARLAHISGAVVFRIDVDPNGETSNFSLISGHPMLHPAVQEAVKTWKFPPSSTLQQVEGTVEFATNCPKTN